MLLRIQILLHITGDNCVACSIGVYVYCVCLRSATRDIFVYVVCLVTYQAAFPSRHAERRSVGSGMWEMHSAQEHRLLESGGPLPVCIQQCTPGNVRIAVSMQVGRARNNSAVRLCGGGVVCTECIAQIKNSYVLKEIYSLVQRRQVSKLSRKKDPPLESASSTTRYTRLLAALPSYFPKSCPGVRQ